MVEFWHNLLLKLVKHTFFLLIFHFVFIFLLTIPAKSFSQELSNLRSKNLIFTADTIILDSLSIEPNSIKIYNKKGEIISPENYFFDFENSKIIFNDDKKYEKIKIEYRVFPFKILQKYSHKDTSIIVPKLVDYQSQNTHSPTLPQTADILPSQTLEKQGNITRGVNFGNNQDFSLNSNLNLQLSGKINDEFSVIASITDDNIPIQADGNTQQVQDFDKIFISVYSKKNKLTVGDHQIFRPKGYFINYSKKLKGIDYETDSSKIYKNINLTKNKAGVAIAKGKYNRQTFNGIEANQGPYKLNGKNGETFIIVLSNSEKVYIDGVLLTRGENQDYTINYNSAEITFTHNQLITKDKRITVEFEYSEQNYTKFLFYNNTNIETESGNFFFNIYSESDAKNQTISQELTEEQKLILAEIGDSLQLASFPSADSVEFESDKILYQKKDTLVGTQIFEDIFVHSQNSEEAHFLVSFSYVGTNAGNYKIDSHNANGRVYAWVAPVNNSKQGDYEAIRTIITPQKKQVFAVGGEQKISRKMSANFEIALSNNDINTFSAKDANDNFGFAGKTSLKNYFLGNDSTDISLYSSVNYEFTHKNFNPVDFYRNTEFERDWNIENSTFLQNENILGLQTFFKKSNLLLIDYQVNAITREKDYFGVKNMMNTNLNYKNFENTINASYLKTKTNFNKTDFFRSQFFLKKNLKYFSLGIDFQSENNKWKNLKNDSLLENSFAFNQFDFFVKTPDTLKFFAEASYKKRFDYVPIENQFFKNEFSDDYNFAYNFRTGKSGHLGGSFTYRKLFVSDTSLTTQQPENSLVGAFNLKQSFFRRALSFFSSYQFGSGLERKNEYSYIEVPTGEGLYKWIDYNSNGIKELNEFEVANFSDEATHLRVFRQSNDYVKVYTNKITQTASFVPRKLWKNPIKLAKIASFFSDNLIFRLEQSSKEALFPLNSQFFSPDSSLTSLNSFFQNSVFINKGGKVNFSYITNFQQNKLLLMSGIDDKKHNFNSFTGEIKFWQWLSLTNNLKLGLKSADFEFFSDKNYEINYNFWETKLDLNFDKHRFSVFYNYQEKKNFLGVEKSFENRFGAKQESRVGKNGKISADFSYININAKNIENQSIGYIILEGLQAGNNFVWNASFGQNLSNGLQISFLYSGRYSESGKIIHTGNVQVSAGF